MPSCLRSTFGPSGSYASRMRTANTLVIRCLTSSSSNGSRGRACSAPGSRARSPGGFCRCPAAACLAGRAGQRAGEGGRARWGSNSLDLVFTTRNGRPIEASTINRALRTLAKRCKLRPLHPHALRHSCATFLKAKKVDVIVIRDILGHSQLSVTADIYTHVLAPELREAIDMMDAILGGDAGGS